MASSQYGLPFKCVVEIVNDGGWKHSSIYETAINSAIVRSHETGFGGQIKHIRIRRLSCDQGHVDLCDHLEIELIFGEYEK